MKAYGILPEVTGAPPPVPTNLTADQTAPGLVRILWDEASGTATASIYQVYRDGAPIGTVANQIYQDSNVSPNQTYSYQVQAISDSGAASALSAPLSVSTTGNTAPVWDASQSLQALTEGIAYDLNLLSVCTDADGQTLVFTQTTGTLPTGVQFYPAIGHVSGTPDYTSQGDHVVGFEANDQHGGVVDFTFTFRVANVDVTAPTVPVLSASNITQSSVDMSWTASTDTETGVDHYNLYRNATSGSPNPALRVATPNLSYQETGLQSSFTRYYRVSAVDVQGNESALSNEVAVTTLAASDTAPPTVPTGVTVNTPTTSSLKVSWTASTDNVGVAGYNVWQSSNNVSFTKAGTVNALTYTATGLSPGSTYYFYVTAFDAASPVNESAASTTVSASTSAATGNNIKWNPGIYSIGATETKVGVTGWSQAEVDEIGAMPNIIGRLQYVDWSQIETSRGVYDFNNLDALFKALKLKNKHLVIEVLDRSFSGTSSYRLPGYLASETGGGGGWYVKPTGGVIAKLWLPAIQNRLIALYQAIATQYDNDPFFEGIVTCESDSNFTTGPSDYSVKGWMDGLTAVALGAKAAFQHSIVWCMTNFIPTGQTDMPRYVTFLRDNGLGFTTPDTVVNGGSSDWGTRVVHGDLYVSGAWSSGAGHNYRGELPVAHNLEDPELGGKEGGFSPDTLYTTWSHGYNGDNHWFVIRHNYVTGTNKQTYWDNTAVSVSSDPPAGRYTPDLKTYINQGGHPTFTTKPTNIS